jgi:2'-5' RNA ligase
VSTRLFAALVLPDAARAALHAWARPVCAADPALRALAPEALHVTLVFLGSQPEDRVAELAALVTAAAGPLPELTVTGAALLPPRRPGVLVADLSCPPQLAGLQGALAAALEPFRPLEARPYRPHVTVARVRRDARPAPPAAPPPALAFAPAGVALYRSRLGPAGARYELLTALPSG